MREKEKVNTIPKTEIKELKYKISNLESSLKNNDNLIDMLSDFLILIDTDGKILAINKTMAKSLGKKKADLIGKNILDYFPPEVAKHRTKMANQVINSKKPIIFEDKRDGRWFKTKIFPILETKGNVIQIATSVKEITEEKKQLMESEEKSQILSDQLLMGIGIIQGGQIKYANNAITQITGYSKDDLFREGTKILTKIVLPEYLSFVQEQLQKKLAGDKDVINRYSFKIITKTGVIKWIELFSKTINYEGKNADLVTFIDITDAKKAEETVRASEEKWRSLVENAPDMITQIDSKGIMRYVNHLPKDEIYKNFDPVGKKVINFVPKEYRTLVENTYDRVLKTGESEKFEVQGSMSGRWFSTHVGAIFDNETPIGLTTITRDITIQKKADYNIRRGKEYLQSIIDSTSEIIFTIGNDGKIKTWNKTAEQTTGHKKRQVIGKSIKQLDIFYNSSEIEEYIKNIQNKKTAYLYEISIKTLYGVTKTFSISPSYIKDESNNITEILFVCRDITKEKETFGKIQPSNSYLIQESDNITAIDLFNFLLESKKLGLYIGRITNKELQASFKKINPKIIKLTEEKDDRYSTINNMEEIYQKIKDFIINKKNTVILIDRMDYLITNYSFESVMKTLYKINDLIQKHNSILLLHVNPSIINQKQIAILNEDFKKLPSQQITDLQISQELYEILTYIQNESKNNITVTYGNIGKTFSISKVTAKKRLESLKDKELIYSRKHGKTKILNITDKGKNLLKNRE